MTMTQNVVQKQQDSVSRTRVVATSSRIYRGAAVGLKPSDQLLYPMGTHVS
jgi:hypothetical protein